MDSQNRTIFGIAIVLIAAGAFFLIVELFNIRLGVAWWPFLFLLPGLGMLGWGFSTAIVNAGIAVGGANLATLGAIFLYQAASGNWESWAYIWALFPLASGLTLIAAGNKNNDETMTRSGSESARWGAIAFVIGVIVFEVFIFGGLIGYVIPLALIGVGVFILWNNSRTRVERDADSFMGGPAPGPGPVPPPPYPGPTSFSPAPGAAAPRPAEPTPTVPAPEPPAPTFPVQPPPPPAIVPTAPPPPAGPVVPGAPEVSPEPFPTDELPAPPVPDDAPFPADDQAEVPAKPRPRTRSRRTS